MPKKNDVTKIDATKFSPELKEALVRFAKTYVRFQAVGFFTEKAPSGVVMNLLTTRSRSIGEDYNSTRQTLLTFRSELPLLAQLDYSERGEYIQKALRNATDDEIAEELEAAHADIKQLEDRLAAIGLKLGLEK